MPWNHCLCLLRTNPSIFVRTKIGPHQFCTYHFYTYLNSSYQKCIYRFYSYQLCGYHFGTYRLGATTPPIMYIPNLYYFVDCLGATLQRVLKFSVTNEMRTRVELNALPYSFGRPLWWRHNFWIDGTVVFPLK
jgi:hypothetical protein